MITRYSKVAIALHWAIAILIMGNIAGAMLTEGLPKETRGLVMGFHKSFGIIVLFLAVARIIWRVSHRPPAKPESLAAWEKYVARTVHLLFYLLMILVPLSGWVWMSAGGWPVEMFGLFTMPDLPVGESKQLADAMHDRHETLGLAMFVLVVLHVAGALKHQFIDRMPFIQRMWP
jgi:cytochrome b561